MNYQITFDGNGGTISGESIILTEDGYFRFPTVDDREGFDFVGWSLTTDGSELFTDENQPVTEDITLYAIWEKINCTLTFMDKEEKKYRVFYFQYGTELGSDKIIQGPGVTGYDFEGWFTDKECTKKFYPGVVMKTNITLYPKYKIQTYTITFAEATSSLKPFTVDVNYGEKVEEPTKATEWAGHTLKGYYLDKECSQKYDFNRKVTGPFKIYIEYEIDILQVSFVDTDGTELYDTLEVEYESIISKPDNPSKEGFKFLGWLCDGEKYEFNLPVTKSIQLVANWQEIICKVRFYTTYNVEILDPDIKVEVVRYGQCATKPKDYKELGFTFKCWSLSSTTIKEFDFSQPITEDVKLYAIMDVEKCVVHYMSDDKEIYTATLEYGQHANPALRIPEKENCNFIEWVNQDGTAFDFTSPIIKETFIYAKFDATKVAVIFNTVGGNIISPQVVDYNTAIERPDDPIKKGYTFQGWYDDSTFTNEFNFNILIQNTMTIYALWEINTYNVTFKCTDDEEKVKEVKYDNVVVPIPDPIRPGYTFMKWTDEDGNEFDFANTRIIKDTVVVAQWIRQTASNYSSSFLAMVNSDDFFTGDDVTAAILAMRLSNISEIEFKLYTSGKLGIDQYLSELELYGKATVEKISNITVDQFFVIYHWAINKSFPPGYSYKFTFDKTTNTMTYERKEIQYSVPLAPSQINTIIQRLYDISVPQTDCSEIGKYLTNWATKFPVYTSY